MGIGLASERPTFADYQKKLFSVARGTKPRHQESENFSWHTRALSVADIVPADGRIARCMANRTKWLPSFSAHAVNWENVNGERFFLPAVGAKVGCHS